MQDASATPSPTNGADAVVVRRPDPGLARGLWEAPPWLFVAVAAAVCVALTVAVARRWRKTR